MRRVREVLRLGFAGISKHEIARRTGLAASTVRETIERFKTTGLDWPLPEDGVDRQLTGIADRVALDIDVRGTRTATIIGNRYTTQSPSYFPEVASGPGLRASTRRSPGSKCAKG